MSTKRPTMGDVARLAGVSKSTVSHVLNNTRYVAPETTNQVQKAIAHLEYRPSRIARSLAANHTNTIGLLISDIDNPFYPRVIKGVEEIALAHSYHVFLANVGYNTQRIIDTVQTLLDHQIDGAICMSTRFPDELIEILYHHHLPTVFVDWQSPSLPFPHDLFTSLSIDFRSGIGQAARHLTELGHRRFAHISGPLDAWTTQQRQTAFLEALKTQGIGAENVMVIEGDMQVESGRSAFHTIMETKLHPTAVFAANDLMALGFLWEARDLSMEIPRDFSVVGLDNIPLASQISPGLSTVSLPIHDIGQRAMLSLLQRIDQSEGKTGAPAKKLSAQMMSAPVFPAPEPIPTEFIRRGSTAPPKERVIA